MSLQPDWDVYRYVMDDPTLDRHAFEERMLQDESLAWAVADAVEHIAELRTASLFVTAGTPVASDSASAHRSCDECATQQPSSALDHLGDVSHGSAAAGWHWSHLAAMAAGLLAMIGLASYRLENYSRSAVDRSLSTVSTQSLAEHWLALDEAAEANETSTELWLSDEPEVNVADATSDSDLAVEDKDWLIEAARMFYAEGVVGG